MVSQLELLLSAEPSRATSWLVSHKFDKDGARLADGHYSRRTPGSPQFMPPGETLVLVQPERDAIWGWWRPHPSAGIVAMNGLDGWTCSIFRNTGGRMSSDLVLEAEIELLEAEARGDTAGPCGPDGLLTYVWPKKILSTNPGWCFQLVGWTRDKWTQKGKRLLRKPHRLAGVAACAWPKENTRDRVDEIGDSRVEASLSVPLRIDGDAVQRDTLPVQAERDTSLAHGGRQAAHRAGRLDSHRDRSGGVLDVAEAQLGLNWEGRTP